MLETWLGVSSVLEGYFKGWGKTHRFYSNALPFGVRSITYVSKFCKPLDLKQSH
jgi:hypothetical protein